MFATGLKQPFGIAFYPPGRIRSGCTSATRTGSCASLQKRRFEAAGGHAEHLRELHGGSTWHGARSVFSQTGRAVRGRRLALERGRSGHHARGVPSREHPRVHAGREVRARVRLRHPQLRAAGAIDPKTGELWCSINERDALGDNLVPDYITHVQEGGFYGWPWWYMGDHQDPRHDGKHPGTEGQGHRARCAVAAAQRVARDDLLRRQAISGGVSRATSSRPSTAPGTNRRASATK